MMEIVLEAKEITKDFPGVRALDGVSIQIQKSQIHALCGENGAGKSTLINVFSGYYPSGSYVGTIIVDAMETRFNTIHEAESAGIVVIHQELSLFKELNVTENIFVGHELHKRGFLDWDAMYSQTFEWLKALKIHDVLPTTKMKDLGIAKQQLIQIARALRIKGTKVLILDEPTASLTRNEVALLMSILRDLQKQNIACIYISHRLDEVMEIADYITVLRDGKTVGGNEINHITKRELIKMMVGREITEFYPPRPVNEKKIPILSVQNLDMIDPTSSKKLVQKVSFDLYTGEILGLFGLIGAGRTELVNIIFGNPLWKFSGKVMLKGMECHITSPLVALKKGIVYMTEDRKAYGIIPSMDVRGNVSIAFIEQFCSQFGGIDQDREIIAVNENVNRFHIKTPSITTSIINLSGGNQQKALLARGLLKEISVLILDEPTRGIDVGAKREIYTIMNSLVQGDMGIIMVSSELPEILGMCDRILVMCQGYVTKEFDNSKRDVTQEDVMVYATGSECRKAGES
jgi:D-xylose transport system ATP-binding protein